MEGADFHLGIGSQLAAHAFHLSGLDVQLPLKDMYRPKRPHPGLIPLHRSQIVNSRILQKLTYAFHFQSLSFLKIVSSDKLLFSGFAELTIDS